MFLNLTEHFENQGKEAILNIPYEAEEFFDGFENRKILSKTDLKLSILNMGDSKLKLSGSIEVVLLLECGRCLQPVESKVSADFEYSIIEPDGYHEPDDEGQDFMKGYELDTETLINNELIMSLPMKVLCKETCKGLCPVCGKNLNDGECGCDTFIPDPRMAAISDIFNAIKEV